MADKVKLAVAILIVIAAVAGFYVYADQSTLFRVIGLLVALIVAILVIIQTAPGRTALGFLGDARTEVRKVVWPTRKETVQTTLIVLVMVIVVAIGLFFIDSFLLWAINLLIVSGD
ncbi:MAG: preprotein translocase subunit SecE [Gammaproteobacteria bacterium]|nr:preprotein translocase subunit SecE [Gammaproteobacteria bacterium]PCH64757.1 MAG: preprotein translocase subunit SecE [Gammaproteobacteria bacterium]